MSQQDTQSTCQTRDDFANIILTGSEDELRDEAEARRREDAEEMMRTMKEESEHDNL